MKELVLISKYAGMREDLVQAGGGNSSVKLDQKYMEIKSSGIQMADITDESGFSIVDYAMIKEYMDLLLKNVISCTEKEILDKALIEGKRPSIETFLHAITGRVTLHTHPVSVNVLAARKCGMEDLQRLFPNALLVGYATPGIELAKNYYRTYVNEHDSNENSFPIIFLKNHGLIVSGETSEEVIQITEYITKTIEQEIGMDNTAYRQAYELYEFFNRIGINTTNIVVKVENKNILDLYESYGYRLWDYQICPDCVVFCGKKAFSYSPNGCETSVEDFISQNGIPVLVQYGCNLFICAESIRKAREIESVLAFSAQVAKYNINNRLDLLKNAEQDYLLGWDVEKYRRMLK